MLFSQSSLKQRENKFYTDIENLRLNPAELVLKLKSNRYNRDSLLKYYDHILSDYQMKKDILNNEQNILWLHEIGSLQIEFGYSDLSIESLMKAIKLTDKVDYVDAYIQLNYNLGRAYRHIGMRKKSNDILLNVLNSSTIQMDSLTRIDYLEKVAENYETTGELQLAMETSLEIYHFHSRRNDYARASYSLIQIGRISRFIEADTSYLEYFHQANELALKSNNEFRIENNLVNTGMAYCSEGYPEVGIKYLVKAEKYKISQENAYTITALANAYLNLDSLTKACSYARKGIVLSRKFDIKDYLANFNTSLARCYVKMKQYDSARIYFLEAVSLHRILNNHNIPSGIYKDLSDVFILLEDYPTAILYLDSSYNEYAKFVTEKNEDKLAELRVESDYYIHRNQIAELVFTNKVEKERNRKLFVIITGVIIILILTLYFTMIFRKRLKQLRESYVSIVKKNIELDKVNGELHECKITQKKKIRLENIKHEDIIIKKLSLLLQKDEVFTNPELSLKSLADTLGTNTSYLSAIINSHFKCNLPSLINQHRIDKARKILVSDEYKHYSMEGIAIEVGFKSRSVFYQAFKTVTGLNPSLYVENYKLAVSE